MRKIIIGTRGSEMALVQTNTVKKKLQKLVPHIPIEIKIITTKGDKNMNPVPLDSIGKGWFTKEIDKATLEGAIDIAVHSLKDVPEELEKGLVIAAIPKREDAREALVSKDNKKLSELKRGAIIGTDSTRRKSQILYKRPDLFVESVRGNVPTRIEKMKSGQYDALVLAVAGLKRLGIEDMITEYFDEMDFVPSPGQGALAVISKKENTSLLSLLKKLNHMQTINAVLAEREFSNAIGGGCKMPVGAYALVNDKSIILHTMLGSLDGKNVLKDKIQGDTSSYLLLARKIAQRMVKNAPWYE